MTRREAPVARLVLSAAALAWVAAAVAGPAIYTCVDVSGRRLTSDRPIPECNAREQRVLNADGSVRRVLPPTLTAEERARAEAAERDAATERAARQDAIRRDRMLMTRFPNEAVHQHARAAALADVRQGMQRSQARLVMLARERKPLLDEAEFYAGRTLPLKLKLALDANDAAVDVQRSLMQNQQLEIERINARFDVELARLKRLWAGTAPGSLGPLPAPTPATGPPSASAPAPPQGTDLR